MKLLLILILLLGVEMAACQSLDFVSVRKKNGRVIKNFYRGSDILLQTHDNHYLQGPINAIRNDSVFITYYDIRVFPTTIGTYVKDTISTSVIGLDYRDIKRIHLNKRSGFFQRNTGALLMIGGAGYLTLNVLNGALFDLPITDKRNLRTLSFSAGIFGLGYLFQKLFSSDGFSKKKHQIVYINL